VDSKGHTRVHVVIDWTEYQREKVSSGITFENPEKTDPKASNTGKPPQK
jgi:hypothetical protein